MSTPSQTPDEPAELNALGALVQQELLAGRLAAAVEVYRRILAIRPDLAEARNDLGILLAKLGELSQAATELKQVVALRPNLADAHNNLGIVLKDQGELGPAATHFQRAIALRPSYAEAYHGLAAILCRQGLFEQAASHFEQAIALRPDHANAHNDLGVILAQLGKLDEAAAHFLAVITLLPGFAEAHNNLGNVLWKQEKLAEAAQRFEQALALRPDFAEAHNNLGSVLVGQQRLDQATARFEQAVALRPDYPEALNNLGKALLQQDQIERAIPMFERAIALRPDHADAELSLGMSHLLRGDFARGWPHFEARLRLPGLNPPTNLVRWNGQPLAGRRVLLLAEQGVGDTIQFLRYARLLKARGARVVLAARPAVGRLLASHPDLDELHILDAGRELPPVDFYLPLMSAPGALGKTVSTIPCEVPYLWADVALVERWRDELAAIAGFKIGVAWQGARDYEADRWRSTRLACFAPLARLPGVRLVSLQKGLGAEQVATAGFSVLDLSDRLDVAAGPFMDTAAVIRNLDLVVSVDTSIAHLAAAMGSPVLIALPFSADWRWMRGRDDSPWYPTVRLFRQKVPGDWPEVFERIAHAVEERRAEMSRSKGSAALAETGSPKGKSP